MAVFDLFRSLPPELRLKIWRFTLQDEQARLVIATPIRSRFTFRSGKLPVISGVNRESREEFLRLYVRLFDPLALADGNRQSHDYLNPRMDGLVLGAGHVCEPSTSEYVHVLPQAARGRIREVRLHDIDFSARVLRGIRDEDPRVDVGYQEASGVAQLPPLYLPNLSTIWIVSLCAYEIGTVTSSHWGYSNLYPDDYRIGVTFRYSQSLGRVYVADTCMDDSELLRGFKSAGGLPDFEYPGPHFVARIELLLDDSELPSDGWTLLGIDSNAPPADRATWNVAAQCIALRLRGDLSRD